MTDEVYEYQQSMQEQARAAHRTPISPTRIASEAENHKKDGPCKTLVLPNLPSVAGRVKYAMGTMNLSQFSQRTGISGSYLGQLCSGKAKTLSAYNANRIAGASSMGVTVGWLLGLPKPEEKQPPTPPPEPELPDIPDFWERLEWAVKRDGRSFRRIEAENKLSRNIISATLTRKNTPTEKNRKAIADALNVNADWLCAGLKSDEEIAREKAIKAYETRKKSAHAQTSVKEKNGAHVKPQILEEVWPSKPSILQSTGTHPRFEDVYSGDVLSTLVSVLKGTYRVSLTIDEVEKEL
nr:MAG TPA: repressor protein [Caudoviricetes sp.]